MALKDLERLAYELEILMEALRRTPETPVRRQIQYRAWSIIRRIQANGVVNG